MKPSEKRKERERKEEEELQQWRLAFYGQGIFDEKERRKHWAREKEKR